MKVTLYKSADGSLHEKFEDFAAREAELKVVPAVSSLLKNSGVQDGSPDSDGALWVAHWVARNADKLREILNTSVVVKRGRKTAKPAVATA